MIYESGYVYHIKDGFFVKVNDDKLMANKEGGNFRPTYYCMKDNQTSLLWVIPMSSRVEKYQGIYNKQVEKYGKCITIVMGEYDGGKSAFLIQNMFPTTENYLDHIHTKNGNPVPVNTVIQKIISQNMQQVKQLLNRNAKIVFPDVKRIEKLMLCELECLGNHNTGEITQPELKKEHTPFNNLLVELRSTEASPKRPKSHEPER